MHKNKPDKNLLPCESAQHVNQVRRISWIGLAVNLFLATLKFVVGFVGNSQAVIADAVHSLSDMGTDLAVIFGVKYWSVPADEDHPYGHWRIETIVTAVIGISLVMVAMGIGYNSLATMRDMHLKQPGWIALVGVVVSIVLKEWLYHWTFAVGRRTKSSAVIANAWHHRSDALSSIPALIAVTAAAIHPSLAFLDYVGALVVSLIILKVSWKILSPALSELTDRGAPHKDREKIKSIAMDVNGVKHVHAIRTRKVGTGLFVDLHVLVDGETPVRKGHQISRLVKYKLIEQGPEILDVVVHLEPYDDQK
ncbi:MAG: cation diffusion facilitator family transporter [Candidatus Desulfatibia sp.]|jgi:cation diffusion facilitator family transporter|uniref:cation diffusion facilitator family transporter n=1 Tax=Candidatus Desulfatibia sp. TaxID=3101189 RepID=UPI002F333C85